MMLEGFLLAVGCVLAAGLLVILGRYAWLWWTRVRPRRPHHDREWLSDCAEHGFVKHHDGLTTIRNVRDFTWRSVKDHDIQWTEKTVDPDGIKDVWFIIDHFHRIKGLAHTMLSFEFEDGQVLSFSFETRRGKGERYHPWDGMWRAFELYLLVSTERDALFLRTNIRNHRVHMFRVDTAHGVDKALFLQLCRRLNQLGDKPEWYHTLTASCTTTIVSQVNAVIPGTIPFNWRTFLPGHAARAAHRYGLIEDWGGYDKTLDASRIDQRAQSWNKGVDYSQHIREFMPNSP